MILNPSLLTLLISAITFSKFVNAQGSWSILANNRVVCVHTFLLPDNKIMCLERPHVLPYTPNPFSAGNIISIMDLNKNNEVTILETTRNTFCAGHAQLGDGKIVIIGGDVPDSTTGSGAALLSGLRARRTFTPCKANDATCVNGGTFEYLTDMTVARWYPTVTVLASGESIVVSGSLVNLDFNDLSNTNNPTYEFFPSRPEGVKFSALLNYAYPYNLYPFVYQLTNGNILIFASNRTNVMDTATETIIADQTKIRDILLADKMPWMYPYTASSIMLPLTKSNKYTSQIMICGGSRALVNNVHKADERCIAINFADADPQWIEQTQDPMPVARLMPDSVLLPDGTVLFMNGAGYGMAGGDAGDARNAWDPVYSTHLYNPEAPAGSKWSTMASSTVPRLYHSGAILLADGRVVTSGSEMKNLADVHNANGPRQDCFPFVAVACSDPFEYRMEVFSPPYLSLSVERPIITQAPERITYTSSFGVTTSTNSLRINKAAFVRYSTSTHSLNMDQRYIEANIVSVNATYLLIEAPADGNIAPPGNYFLFILRGGKPSVAATILIGAGDKTIAEAPIGGQNPDTSNGLEVRVTKIVMLCVSLVLVLGL